MTIAYWCILAAFLLPYGFVIAAKAFHPKFNNLAPRDYLDYITGWRKRAHWVQLNSYEIFAPFAAAVIISHLLKVDQKLMDNLALLFIISRILYGFCYLGNKASLRSLSWFVGFAIIIALFMLSARV